MSAESKPLPIIEVINLRKKYGLIQALKGISFSIGKGEIVGFLGPNGAGKSTTLRILSGLIPADSGEAKVCGVDLAEEEGEVRKHIGYLAENNPLPEDLRVIE
ncbi:MAG: ATP-binding cassette domain-containing protein, partial [Verrucomicrobiota bacterium]|nr:ATP-binding cassette domain-containing protein [Verrucomicrobiota bacterium]